MPKINLVTLTLTTTRDERSYLFMTPLLLHALRLLLRHRKILKHQLRLLFALRKLLSNSYILKRYCVFYPMRQNISCGYFAFNRMQMVEMAT